MGISIDEAINMLIIIENSNESLKTAIETIRKYQKIQEIVEHWACCGNPSDSMIAISEVIEDEKIS